MRSISSKDGLQLLNVLVTRTLSHRSFNYDTDHKRERSVIDTVALRLLYLDRDSEPIHSLISLHVPQERPSSTGQSCGHIVVYSSAYHGPRVLVKSANGLGHRGAEINTSNK